MATRHGCGTERDRKNQRKVIVWGLAWSASFAGVFVALTRGWLATGAPALVATALSLALGIGTAVAYRKSLREADELRRKIELDASALAFGVGLVGGATYQLLEGAGVVADARLIHVWIAMMLTYAVAIHFGYRSYR